jgi:hypothetical protein
MKMARISFLGKEQAAPQMRERFQKMGQRLPDLEFI